MVLPEKRYHFGNLDVNRRIILKWILKKYENVDLFQVAQDRAHWWPPVNMILNLRVPLKTGNFLSSWVTIRF
jgi:hypothetical protein